VASLLNQSGQLNTFDPTITGADYRDQRLAPTSKTSILNQSYGDYMGAPGRRGVLSDTVASPDVYASASNSAWEAGRDARVAGNVDTMNTTTADNYSYSEGTGGMTNAQANAIGAGIEGAATIAGGIIGNVKGKKKREAAVAEAERQLGQRREERAEQWELEDQQIANQKDQARYEQMMQNNVLRLNMFERDFAKEMQRYQDQQDAMARFNKNSSDNEAYKMAIAQRMGNM
jgi:hypothetical protein